MGRMIPDNLSEQPQLPGEVEPADGFSESLFQILWRRRWTVLAASVLSLAAAFVYLQRATPLYSSTSRVYVEQSGPRILDKDEQGIMTQSRNYLYTQAELVRSGSILSEASKSLGATRLRTFADVSNPLAALRAGVKAEVGKKDEIINISFMCPYPEEAAHVVNEVVDAYVTFHEQRKRSTSAEVLRVLKDEKAKRNDDCIAKLNKMMEFKRKNEGLAFGNNQSDNIIIRKLERLTAALTEAQLATMAAESYFEAVKSMENDPAGLRYLVESQRGRGLYPALADESAAIRKEIERLQRWRADCLLELLPDHPGIKALDAEIARLTEQIDAEDAEFVRHQLAIALQQYEAAKNNEEEMAAHVEQQRQEAISLNSQLAEYTVLESDYEQTRRLSDLLDERIKEVDTTSDVAVLNISILEAAAPALEPSEPQKAKTMGLALCLGLFAGMGLALVLEWKDQRIRSTEEISALLGLPVLGAVPSMASPKQTPSIRGQKIRISPDSHEAEAIRTVRTAVFFAAPKEESKTILITSPAPGEGKSTTVSNLALAIAQAGQKVLIVDADFRRPTQHKIFRLDRQVKGLSLVLAGQQSLAQAIEHMGMENLDVLTCGPNVSNPAEMLNSESFRKIIEAVGQKYDRVIVDSPPVLAVTDALILAARCDVTILVLRAEKSTRRVSMQARDALAAVNARVLGAVVNDVPRKTRGYGSYSGYGYYYYGYGSDSHGRKRKKIRSETAAERMVAETAPIDASEEGEASGDLIVRK